MDKLPATKDANKATATKENRPIYGITVLGDEKGDGVLLEAINKSAELGPR